MKRSTRPARDGLLCTTALYVLMGGAFEGGGGALHPFCAPQPAITYSQVGYLNNTTSSLSLFYADFIGGAVVLIADY